MSSEFLDAAAAIGRRIASDAVWQDGRCSWMGAVDGECRALDATLYRGTAGVGLFLAHLAAATGEESARRTAGGALRQSVARSSSLRGGLHGGVLGVAWAAAEAGAVLDDESLGAGARTVLAEPRGRAKSRSVVLGAAGEALALLSLARRLGDDGLREQAVDAGEALLASATVTRHGWSWASLDHRWPRHLCGVSHGAAGIGWALTELFAATGDERFRAGAAGAFAYERSWLDADSGTWPDLRIPGQRRGAPPVAPSPAAGSWCHGEAGIALSRLRASAVLGPGPHRGDAEIALEATRRHLAEALPYAFEDVTLCHGAAGAADVLLSGSGAREAADFGRVAIERYAGTGEWPCGTDGTTPALFRGLSGIGWLFLRLHDPTTPSPLLVG